MEEFEILEYLREERGGTDYQIEKICELISSFEHSRDRKCIQVFNVCPKFGKIHPEITKGGFTRRSGKQMYRCTSCGRRFTYDHGSITWYSHQDEEQFRELIQDTFEGKGLPGTSRSLGVNIETAFNMGHRLMGMMEKAMEQEVLSGSVQLDETYMGTGHESRAAKDMDESGFSTRIKRGLSRQKVCILSKVNGSGNAFALSYGCGIPSRKAVSNLSPHIADSCSITTDDTAVYDSLIRAKGLFHRICRDCTDHRAAVNLNRINSFHSMIKSYCRGYRGVASKYINRYVLLFSYAWKFMKAKGEDLKDSVMDLVRSCSFSITLKELKGFRLFEPLELKWRPAS